MSDSTTSPTLAEAARVWARVGLLGFGGPSGQIALLHREVVEIRGWISEARFLHALNFCMLLPGPEAQQLATYLGWMLHGTRGGLVAGTLFVLPGFLVILALSALYALHRSTEWVGGLFFGLKAAVLVIVAEALIRVGRRALRSRPSIGLAASAFLALFVFTVPFPAVVLAAGLVGVLAERAAPGRFLAVAGAGSPDPMRFPVGSKAFDGAAALRTGLAWGAVWVVPILIVALVFGPGSTFTDLAVFFSEMAMVTFGGAYAVLAWVSQAAVESHGWLTAGEMVDGLALAETTPGPLILVLAFVGFLAGFRDPSGLAPLLGGVLGAGVTTWVTFAPSFLWIFLGAPHVERLRGNAAFAAALAAIGAAVVGVMANLALWFALHVLFREVERWVLGPISIALPRGASLDPSAALLVVAAAVASFGFRIGVPKTLVLCGLIGAALQALG